MLPKIEKPFRKIIVVWAATLITWVVIKVFMDVSLITGAVVTALSAVIGLLGTAIMFYKFNRHKEENK